MAPARKKKSGFAGDASAAGKKGGKNKLTAAEKRERDLRVIQTRLRPATWAQVAKETGLGTTQCKVIWRKFRESKKSEIAGLDAVDWVVETFEFYEAQMIRLGEIAAASDDNHNAKVGALKAQREAKSEQTALLQSTGFLPTDLGKVREDVALRQILEELLAVFDEMGVPAEVEERLLARLETLQGRPLGLPIGAG